MTRGACRWTRREHTSEEVSVEAREPHLLVCVRQLSCVQHRVLASTSDCTSSCCSTKRQRVRCSSEQVNTALFRQISTPPLPHTPPHLTPSTPGESHHKVFGI
uniref:Uncharacterized protein n=1 Tax=Mesocestoides corti TaxID=53468 RepID=A0A5K3ET54_MESCO